MKRSRTGSSAGKAPAAPPVATVQVPLPLLAVLADAKTAFFGLCLTAGQQVFQTLMEQDRVRLCGPKNVPNPDRHAYRGGSAPSEVVLGGRRIVLPRLRARSVTGEELTLPSFAYASAQDPLDAHTLEAIAVGVTTRKYPRTLEPLRPDIPERAVSKSAVSRRFVALTSARLTTWLATPLDDLDIRVVLIDGLFFRDHVILLAVGVDAQGTKHVLALREGTTENATVCKALLADLRARGLDLDRPTLFIIDGGTGLRKAIRETSGALGLVQRCQVHKGRAAASAASAVMPISPPSSAPSIARRWTAGRRSRRRPFTRAAAQVRSTRSGTSPSLLASRLPRPRESVLPDHPVVRDGLARGCFRAMPAGPCRWPTREGERDRPCNQHERDQAPLARARLEAGRGEPLLGHPSNVIGPSSKS